MSVSMVKIADQSTGATRQYQSLNRMADENSASRIKSKDKHGNEAIFTKIKTAEGKFMYVLCNEGEEIKPSKNAKATDALIAPEGPDKKGILTTGEKAKSFFKGLISPFTSLFSNPLVTAGVIIGAVAIGVACVAFPPFAAAVAAATPVIAKVGLVVGGTQVVIGGCQAYNATNDKDAKKGWENMGAGVFTIGTSAISLMQSAKAANAAKTAADAYKGASEGINKGIQTANNISTSGSTAASTTVDKFDDIAAISSLDVNKFNPTKLGGITSPIKQTLGNPKLTEYQTALKAAKEVANVSSGSSSQTAKIITKFHGLLQNGDIHGATKLMDTFKTASLSLSDQSKATELLAGMQGAIDAAKAGALNPASKAAIWTTGFGAGGEYEAANDDIERVYKEVGNVHVLAN